MGTYSQYDYVLIDDFWCFYTTVARKSSLLALERPKHLLRALDDHCAGGGCWRLDSSSFANGTPKLTPMQRCCFCTTIDNAVHSSTSPCGVSKATYSHHASPSSRLQPLLFRTNCAPCQPFRGPQHLGYRREHIRIIIVAFGTE